MSDNSITRVYQFLTDFNSKNGDWKNVADKNSDGVVIKTEFRNFMLNNFDWNGEESNKDDIINQFWKNVDTAQSGKVKGHSKIKNKNALDDAELNKMDKTIKIYEIMNDFVKKNVNAAESGVNNKSQWLKSVKESLASHIDGYIKNGGTEEGAEAFLAEKLPISKSMATANIYAQEYLKSEDVRSNFPEGYTGQGTMQDIISEFVKSLAENDSFQAKSEDEKLSYIKSEVEKLVKAYMATADIGDGDPTILAEYGYYTGGELNDIQAAYLTKSMGDSIQSYLETNYPDICTKENKETIKSAVDAYIQEKLKDASYDDFKTLKNYNAADIVDDDKLMEIINNLQTEFNELAEAKADLKLYCLELENKNDESINAAIKKVFGSMDYKTKIEACKTKDEVNALKEAIEAEVAELDNTISETGLNDETIKLKVNESKNTSLPTTFTSANGTLITTDKIEYKPSGSHISVNGTNVTINGGSAAGTYVESVDIYVNGKKQGSIKYTIVVDKSIDLAKIDAKVGEYTFADIYNGRTKTLQLSGFATWETAKSNAISAINSYLDSLKTVLIEKGLDSTNVSKAIQTTRNYYNAIMDAIYDHGTDSNYEDYNSLNISYLDADGNSKSENTTFSQKTSKREKNAGRTDEGARNINQNSSGIRMNESYAGTNTYEYYINLAVLLDKFQYFYNGI